MNKRPQQDPVTRKAFGILRGFLARGFQTKPFLWVAARIRPVWVLRAVKLLANLPGGVLVVGLFDPNIIRKKLNIRFKQKLVNMECYGGHFLVDVNEHLGYGFFVNDGFDPLVLQVAQYLDIDDTSILLDIGANIGSTCLPFALQYNADVIAVEASKSNALLLLKNASLNKVKLWAHIVCAVDPLTAKSNEWLNLYSKSGNAAANSLFKEWNPSKSTPDVEIVKTMTIDSILQGVDLNRIKIVKIDIEGAEAMALRGFETLSLLQAPLLFEYRIDVMKRDLNDDGSELLQIIDRNFDVFGISAKNEGIALCEFDRQTPCANAIAIPRSRRSYFLQRLPVNSTLPLS